MTQMIAARHGQTTYAMEVVAKKENLSLSIVKQLLSSGQLIIPAKLFHSNLIPMAI